MKTLKTLLIAMITLSGIAITNDSFAQPGFRANISFNTFYNELSPYGRWVPMPRYGQVWIFNEPGFRPYYSNGQWIDTDLGWSWQSGYPWGWATFHYGRWEYEPMYGWFWIPGYEYAPAWVVWSEVDNYYGWAPLGFGVDINVSFGRIPANRWMYAPRARIGYARIDRYCLPYERNHVYYGRQRPVVNVNVYNNVRYERGPSRQHYDNARRPEYRRNNEIRRNAPPAGPRNDNRREYRPDDNRSRYENSPDRGSVYNRPGNVQAGSSRNNDSRSPYRNSNSSSATPGGRPQYRSQESGGRTSNNASANSTGRKAQAFDNIRKNQRTIKAETSR